MRPPEYAAKTYGMLQKGQDFQFLWFSELCGLPICADKVSSRVGKVSDLVFRLKTPYPEAAGIFIDHGWGHPSEFIPWQDVVKIDSDAIFVKPLEPGKSYAPFAPQPGLVLVGEHVIGRTILDTDGRRVEVVNDVHFLESHAHLIIGHVDTSFNGFLRKWWLGGLLKDRLISWKYVKFMSSEEAVATDSVSLSVTSKELQNLPTEDIAELLEVLSGKDQTAFFSALDSETAAETLTQVEPRAQRQLIANLRSERAQAILSEMSAPQLADLFSVLPHDEMRKLIGMLPADTGRRIQAIVSDREVPARDLVSSDFISVARDAKVADVLKSLRASGREPHAVSYVYVVSADGLLDGIVDLRELVLADDAAPMSQLMSSPVIAAESDDLRDDLTELFARYHYRMLPVVDANNRILGVIRYNDIMRGVVTRAKI